MLYKLLKSRHLHLTLVVLAHTIPFVSLNLSALASTPDSRQMANQVSTIEVPIQVLALRRAIIGQESGANFRAVNRHSGALGYGQIMPFNLPSWSQEALGREVGVDEFLNSPDLQIAIIDHRLSVYWFQSLAASQGDEDEAVMRVASWWYSGKPERFSSTAAQYTSGHEYPSIAKYSQSILSRYRTVQSDIAQEVEASRPAAIAQAPINPTARVTTSPVTTNSLVRTSPRITGRSMSGEALRNARERLIRNNSDQSSISGLSASSEQHEDDSPMAQARRARRMVN
jgi:hypothetical protein